MRTHFLSLFVLFLRWVGTLVCRCFFPFFLIHRFHSISFARAQGIPKYKIGFGREKDGRVGERLVEEGGGHGARDGWWWWEQPSLGLRNRLGVVLLSGFLL